MTAVELPRQIATTITANAALVAGRHTPVDATSGAITVTLPASATPGATLSVEKRDSSANAVIVSGTILGTVTTTTIALRHSSITFTADSAGTSWTPTAGRVSEASLSAFYAVGEADYVVTTDGTTITAKPRGGSGLTAYSGTDAYTVIQGAITALTPSGGGTGSAGGKIHLARGTYTLSNELTVIGWENNVYNAMSQLVIEGDGWSSHFVQNTSGKNAIVVKNGASVAFVNFRISVGSSAAAAILGDDNGANIECSLTKSFFNNIHIDTNSAGSPGIYLKNFFYLEAPKLEVLATANHGVVLENTSTTTNYGNSHFGQLHTRAGTSSPYAGLVIRSTQNGKFPNLLSFDNYQCPSAYYGIYTLAARYSSFNFVDIEGMPRPVYFDGNGTFGATRYISIQDGYILPAAGGTAITTSTTADGCRVSAFLQTGSGDTPILDQRTSGYPNGYDVSVSDATSIGNISVTSGTILTVRKLDGTAVVGLPAGATVPTPTVGDSSTKIATTAFVAAAASGQAAPTIVNATGDVTPVAGAGHARITAVGGGGGGAGGGAAALTGGTSTQVGGGGGGAGQAVTQIIALSGVTNIHCAIGAGAAGGAGGVASSGATGNAGSNGSNSGTQSTILTFSGGSASTITAYGGGQGRGGGANSTSAANGGLYGGQPTSGQTANSGLPGCGSQSGSAVGGGAGPAVGFSGRGGGGGGPATATLGGVAGGVAPNGNTGTSAGATAANAPANTGQGGDGGGGGAPGGAGGAGGNGGSGYVVIEWLT